MVTTNRVKFDEASHTYTNMYNKKYTSATTLISKYKQPFEKEKIAAAYAKKHGGTAEYWIQQWAKAGEQACAKGTKFHKRKEDAMLSVDGIVKETGLYEVQNLNSFTEPNIDYTKLPNGIYPELLLWNHYFEIAGLADIVTIEDGWFSIDDYKTNKKIDSRSFHHPRTGYKKMKYPISHVDDCNFRHYELQLSLYAFMLEEMGLKCGKLMFHHHPPGINPDEVQEEGIKYDLQYKKGEVLAMLIHYTGRPYLKPLK
jgi:hypothetical protein